MLPRLRQDVLRIGTRFLTFSFLMRLFHPFHYVGIDDQKSPNDEPHHHAYSMFRTHKAWFGALRYNKYALSTSIKYRADATGASFQRITFELRMMRLPLLPFYHPSSRSCEVNETAGNHNFSPSIFKLGTIVVQSCKGTLHFEDAN